MTMRNEGLAKTFYADAAITKHRIIAAGSADNYATPATAATSKSIGVSDALGAAVGEPFDVILDGIATVEYGGTVTRGDLLTSDANGKAIVAAPAAGSNVRVIGVAMVSGVSGDLGAVNIQLGSMQG